MASRAKTTTAAVVAAATTTTTEDEDDEEDEEDGNDDEQNNYMTRAAKVAAQRVAALKTMNSRDAKKFGMQFSMSDVQLTGPNEPPIELVNGKYTTIKSIGYIPIHDMKVSAILGFIVQNRVKYYRNKPKDQLCQLIVETKQKRENLIFPPLPQPQQPPQQQQQQLRKPPPLPVTGAAAAANETDDEDDDDDLGVNDDVDDNDSKDNPIQNVINRSNNNNNNNSGSATPNTSNKRQRMDNVAKLPLHKKNHQRDDHDVHDDDKWAQVARNTTHCIHALIQNFATMSQQQLLYTRLGTLETNLRSMDSDIRQAKRELRAAKQRQRHQQQVRKLPTTNINNHPTDEGTHQQDSAAAAAVDHDDDDNEEEVADLTEDIHNMEQQKQMILDEMKKLKKEREEWMERLKTTQQPN